ncbi:hypothetical protein NHX12_033970 [Muraenolepis orangiensis]|uniref:Uncharacterized protein n=1 Tax=Muraenolepis orangiensis TaxID=630683 RepID=A0A9Q0E6L8_9TELE|nr:hypothetical protein NHX12_033970 [Muraenolepis orangiensis]
MPCCVAVHVVVVHVPVIFLSILFSVGSQHALSKKNVRTPKTSEVGHYMDISVRPGGKVCLTELSARDAFLESCPPNTRAVRLVQVELLSSSYDSSSFSSDLEWDFEGATTCWREPPEENEEDVLQDWPKNPPQLGSVSDFTEMSLFP